MPNHLGVATGPGRAVPGWRTKVAVWYRALRHAFGISLPMKVASADEVRRGVLALLSGRAAHPHTQAARMITAGDVKTAKAFVAQLTEMKSRQGARKSTSAETARARDVLHAALELFYDRFAAAVDVAFGDEARVSLLSLVPRRKDRRAVAAKPPAGESAQPTASRTGRPPASRWS